MSLSPVIYRIGLLLLNIICSTWQIKVSGTKPIDKGIVLFWHGLMLPGWYIFRKSSAYAVVSLSKDGQILSDLLSSWNFKLIRGSSSKGGRQVLEEITNICSEKIILMTPDGPRGPKNEMKPGAVIASVRTGSPIYLCKINIGMKYIFKKSWDNFILPLPFSRISIDFSEPIRLSNDLSNEEISNEILKIQNELNQ